MPTKQRVALVSAPALPALYDGPDPSPEVQKKVLEVKEGSVTWLDNLKGYYKALIALVGALLIGVTQLSGVVPAEAEPWVTTTISVLTTIGVLLRANETWVNSL